MLAGMQLDVFGITVGEPWRDLRQFHSFSAMISCRISTCATLLYIALIVLRDREHRQHGAARG